VRLPATAGLCSDRIAGLQKSLNEPDSARDSAFWIQLFVLSAKRAERVDRKYQQ
jgi:hypothetical protein